MTTTPSLQIAANKSNEELEDMVCFLRIRTIEEGTQFSELCKTERRLHVHFAQPTAESLLHGQLSYLQEQILEYQDTIMELDCSIKVLRRLTQQNLKKARQQERLLRKHHSNKSSSSKSLLPNNQRLSQLMASPTVA